jgi:hypothetical protein
MPSQSERGVRSLLGVGFVLIGAAPVERLPYDPGVFLSSECLSPALSRCGTAGAREITRRPASEALLDAGREPRLELDFAVLNDIGSNVSAGQAPGSALPR